MKPFIAALLLVLSAAAPAATRAADPGAEKISVPLTDPSRPATLKVSMVNGGLTVEGYGGREVVIEATAGGGEEHESRPRRGAEGMRRIPNSSRGLSIDEENNVVRVDVHPLHGGHLHIQVPVRCSLHLSAVNGGQIRVAGVDGDLELGHVNGSIEARDVSGSVVAHTTNGEVKVSMRRVDRDKPMAFSTLNGNVDVTFPADLRANVRIGSQRGDVYSDFEIAAQGHGIAKETRKGGKRHVELEQEMQGTIGGGGPEILIKTFNGDIYIHRGRG
jgi:hypothetical protein